MRPESGDSRNIRETRETRDIRELVVGSSDKDAPCAQAGSGESGGSDGTGGPGAACGRLDHVLARELGLSLRGARRFFEEHEILVNDRRARPGMLVRPGDRVRISPLNRGSAPCAEARGADRCAVARPESEAEPARIVQPVQPVRPVRLVMTDRDFAFFEKPALLHTQALAGRANESVESRLPSLLPRSRFSQGSVTQGSFAQLLQRLDFETSGLLACALSEESVARFRALEAQGQVEKRYLAVLAGHLEEPAVVKNRLEGRGKRVAALDFADPDRARHTSFTPLMPLEKAATRMLFGHELDATLAGCVIHRGARHQIRVHAAQIAHPLVYDTLYGHVSNGAQVYDVPAARHFLLHHARLSFAGYALENLPAWLSHISEGERQVRNWFAQAPLMS